MCEFARSTATETALARPRNPSRRGRCFSRAHWRWLIYRRRGGPLACVHAVMGNSCPAFQNWVELRGRLFPLGWNKILPPVDGLGWAPRPSLPVMMRWVVLGINKPTVMGSQVGRVGGVRMHWPPSLPKRNRTGVGYVVTFSKNPLGRAITWGKLPRRGWAKRMMSLIQGPGWCHPSSA